MKAKPQVAAFINFFLSYVDEEVVDVGYFPSPSNAMEMAITAWLDVMN